MEYSAILLPVISETNINALQTIQNSALRIILRKPIMTKIRINDLHSEASLVKIKERFETLRTRYIEKAIKNENLMILQLVEEYKNFKAGRDLEYKTLLCGVKQNLILVTSRVYITPRTLRQKIRN